MPVVDELVNIISFDVPAKAKSAVRSFEKSISSVTSKFTTLGVVSTVTGGIMSAFAINSADSVKALLNVTKATGTTMEAIESVGAIYRQTGGDAKNFARDAEAMFKNTGKVLDLSSMKELSVLFADMAAKDERMAYQMGRAMGFSDDMIRILNKGPAAIEAMYKEAEKYGTKIEAVNNLSALDEAWGKFKTISLNVSNDIQGAFSPLLTSGLLWLEDLLKSQKDNIWEICSGISDAIRFVFDAIGDAYEYVKPIIVDIGKRFYKMLEDSGVLEAIKDAFWALIDVWRDLWGDISGADWSGVLGFIEDIFQDLIIAAKDWFISVKELFKSGVFQDIFRTIKDIATSPVLAYLVEGAWAIMIGNIKLVAASFKPVSEIVRDLSTIISGIVNLDPLLMLEGFQQLGYKIIGAFQYVQTQIENIFKALFAWLFKKIDEAIEYIKENANPVKILSNGAKAVGNAISGAASSVSDTVGGWASDAWNWATGNTSTVNAGPGTSGYSAAQMQNITNNNAVNHSSSQVTTFNMNGPTYVDNSSAISANLQRGAGVGILASAGGR